MNCQTCNTELASSQRKFCSRNCYHAAPKSEQMKSRVTIAGKGRQQSAETKEKRAAKLRGRKRPEVGKKIGDALRGRELSEEHRHAISQSKLKSDKARGPNAYQWNPNREEQAMKFARSRVCYGFIGRLLGWIEAGYRDLDEIVPQLGYSSRQLYEHLESRFLSGMSWQNFGLKGWHIDHIRPIASFELTEPMSVVSALDNLQPLWAHDNLSKGKKWQTDL